MKQIRWFDRNFSFDFEQNIFPSIIERLEGTPIRLTYKIALIKQKQLSVKMKSTWSIKENIGHLINLEPIWQQRLDDILQRKEYLSEVDLTNAQTDEAGYNEMPVEQLLNEFSLLRNMTIEKLKDLSEQDIYRFALHPRLKSPMRTMDLFLFVAEHDDHHLARISEISRGHSKY